MSRHFDDDSPFPLSDVSNGEFMPRPPTATQRTVARLLYEEADKRAKKLGMSRRSFLRTAAGTATAFMVLNKVHGLESQGDAAILPVTKEQCDDPEAAREIFKADYFIMDVQLHHVDTVTFANAQFLCFLRFLEGTLPCAERFENLSQMNFIKEVFVDSETAVGVVSGVPDGVPMPVDTMAQTRDLANELAGSQRCVSQCMIDPTKRRGVLAVSDMERQVKELGAIALKTYTGKSSNLNIPGGWYLDDEQISYPMLEEATRLGLRLINVHKGLPQILGDMAEPYVRSRDLPKVSKDWPRLHFVVYHSGYFGGEGEGITGNQEFLDVVQSIRGRRNVHAEIGSAWAIVFGQGPERAAHFIGSLLKTVGSGRIIWGTDSIWWGSPQWQIDAFKAFTIPPAMQEKFGYPALTERDKRRIFGLNAARLYRIKVNEKRCEISADQFSKLRADRATVEANRSLRSYGPRTRREFLALQELESSSAEA